MEEAAGKDITAGCRTMHKGEPCDLYSLPHILGIIKQKEDKIGGHCDSM
jgi:hypothetical protein